MKTTQILKIMKLISGHPDKEALLAWVLANQDDMTEEKLKTKIKADKNV